MCCWEQFLALGKAFSGGELYVSLVVFCSIFSSFSLEDVVSTDLLEAEGDLLFILSRIINGKTPIFAGHFSISVK